MDIFTHHLRLPREIADAIVAAAGFCVAVKLGNTLIAKRTYDYHINRVSYETQKGHRNCLIWIRKHVTREVWENERVLEIALTSGNLKLYKELQDNTDWVLKDKSALILCAIRNGQLQNLQEMYESGTIQPPAVHALRRALMDRGPRARRLLFFLLDKHPDLISPSLVYMFTRSLDDFIAFEPHVILKESKKRMNWGHQVRKWIACGRLDIIERLTPLWNGQSIEQRLRTFFCANHYGHTHILDFLNYDVHQEITALVTPERVRDGSLELVWSLFPDIVESVVTSMTLEHQEALCDSITSPTNRLLDLFDKCAPDLLLSRRTRLLSQALQTMNFEVIVRLSEDMPRDLADHVQHISIRRTDPQTLLRYINYLVSHCPSAITLLFTQQTLLHPCYWLPVQTCIFDAIIRSGNQHWDSVRASGILSAATLYPDTFELLVRHDLIYSRSLCDKWKENAKLKRRFDTVECILMYEKTPQYAALPEQ